MKKREGFGEIFNTKKKTNEREFIPDKWKVLIVDDEDSIHTVTHIALKNFVFQGKEIEFLDAYTAKETIELFKKNQDIAIVILDIVMEENDTGLNLIKFIRNKLKNKNTRIIIRTGYPGEAPERKVVKSYQIDDYRVKTELTSDKLYSVVVACLRTYETICETENHNKILQEMVNERTKELKKYQYKLEEKVKARTSKLKKTNERLIAEINKRKKIEQDLREKEKRYRTLSVNLPGLVYRVNLQEKHTMVFFNKMCKPMTGYTRKELTKGDICTIDKHIHPDDMKILLSIVKKAVENRKPFEIEYRYFHKNGSMRYFSERGRPIYDKNEKPLYIDGVILDITEKKKAEDRIKKDLKEKKVMLQEIHHRVKNNLQIIVSLLDLQSAKIKNKNEALKAFSNSKDRIFAMAQVHESLYESRDMAEVDMNSYIKSISRELILAYGYQKNISIDVNAENIYLDINKAIPCGLIINEIITNSIKHAFNDRKEGKINVNYKLASNSYHLEIADNGTGITEDVEKTGMGLKLIDMLTNQLSGEYSIDKENGTKFKIKFPV